MNSTKHTAANVTERDDNDRSVTPPSQPTLRPGTEVIWRADGDVVIGSRPGAVLHASTADLIGVVRELSSIDGTRMWSQVVSASVPEPLLLDLVRAGCIIDDSRGAKKPDTVGVDAARARVVDGDADNPVELAAARRTQTVVIQAPEPIGSALAQAFATTGVYATDTHSETRHPCLVLHVHLAEGSEPRLDAKSCEAWLRAGIPHMSASVAGTRVRVSNVVLPGQTPCLYCHALKVDDADNTQLSHASALHRAHVPVRHRITLSPDVAALCVGLVLGRALAFMDGLTTRVQDEVILDTTGRLHSSVPVPHPHCGCRLV